MNSKVIISCIILIVFICASSAVGQSFNVKSISEDLQTAVIVGRDTSMEVIVEKGDIIDGWTVVDIKKRKVFLRSEPDEMSNTETQIILKAPESHNMMPSQPIKK